MEQGRTLSFALMDAPYENARSTTALRLIDAALRRGFNVNVFAYEGAIALVSARQTPHPNAVHGRDVVEEDHPNTKDWVGALYTEANKRGLKLDWIQCGLCVDERGITDWIEGPRRGGPPDFVKFVEGSLNTLVIPTK